MNTVKHNVFLHGHLEQFGQKYELAINNMAQLIKALGQLKGFNDVFEKNYYELLVGDLEDEPLGYNLDSLFLIFTKKPQNIHIVPRIEGAKRGGVGKIFLGAAIIAASVLATPAGFAGLAGHTLFGGVTAAQTALFGAAIALNGLSMALQPSIKTNYSAGEAADQRQSFFLGGQVNQIVQGGVVPVIYGQIRVGSTIISAGLTTEATRAKSGNITYQSDISGSWVQSGN